MTLPLMSAAYAAFALTLYVVLDGFDLGVGVLLLFQPQETVRNHMVDSITPTWDGNETWLILAGVTLLAGFPIAYGILMPALYLPLVFMLLALGLRGVSFEFRVQVSRYRRGWDLVFAIGSVVAAAAQGLILGCLFQGLTIHGTSFAGGAFDFAKPFPLLCAGLLVIGYVLLGAGWLRFKGNQSTAHFAVRVIRNLVPVFIAAAVACCLYAGLWLPPMTHSAVAHSRSLIMLATACIVVLTAMPLVVHSKLDYLPFVLGLAAFLLGIWALTILAYPDIIPFRMPLWQAASSHLSQVFLLSGAALVTPVVIAYSCFAYWVFRGKTPDKGWGG